MDALAFLFGLVIAVPSGGEGPDLRVAGSFENPEHFYRLRRLGDWETFYDEANSSMVILMRPSGSLGVITSDLDPMASVRCEDPVGFHEYARAMALRSMPGTEVLTETSIEEIQAQSKPFHFQLEFLTEETTDRMGNPLPPQRGYIRVMAVNQRLYTIQLAVAEREWDAQGPALRGILDGFEFTKTDYAPYVPPPEEMIPIGRGRSDRTESRSDPTPERRPAPSPETTRREPERHVASAEPSRRADPELAVASGGAVVPGSAPVGRSRLGILLLVAGIVVLAIGTGALVMGSLRRD